MIPGDNENDPASFPVIFSNIGKADMVVSYTSNPEERPFVSQNYLKNLYNLFEYFVFAQNALLQRDKRLSFGGSSQRFAANRQLRVRRRNLVDIVKAEEDVRCGGSCASSVSFRENKSAWME